MTPEASATQRQLPQISLQPIIRFRWPAAGVRASTAPAVKLLFGRPYAKVTLVCELTVSITYARLVGLQPACDVARRRTGKRE